MTKKVILNKEVLVASFKKVLNTPNICWGGTFGLKKNSISDMAYLSWECMENDNEIKAMDDNISNMEKKDLWDAIEKSIRYWGLRNLLSLAN